MKEKKSSWKWIFIIIVLTLLAVTSFLIASAISFFIGFGYESDDFQTVGSGNVAEIKITGFISTSDAGFLNKEIASSEGIIRMIDQAERNPKVVAVLFTINSPGGTPVASDEISSRIKRMGKPKVAVIRDMGTSAAYWIASATDKIFASRMSITGSIGAISSYLDFSGIMEKYGVRYERLVSAEYKDIGSPFKSMTEEEKKKFQVILDELQGYFTEEVKNNRNLSDEIAKEVSNGMFFTGSQAKDFGLIDNLGTKEDAIDYIEKELNISVSLVEYKKPVSLMDLVSSMLSEHFFQMGRGIGYSLTDVNAQRDINIIA